MQIRIKNELLLVNIYSVIVILVVALTDIAPLRIAVSIPFLLFLPGYVFVAAIFPEKSSFEDGIERAAFSFGLSLAIVPLAGIILNYIWALNLTSYLVFLPLLVALTSVIAWYRNKSIPQEQRRELVLDIPIPRFGNYSIAMKLLSIVLVLSIISSIAAIAYTWPQMPGKEKFTEFYIYGVDVEEYGYPQKGMMGVDEEDLTQPHRMQGYPREIVLDEDGSVSKVFYAYLTSDIRGLAVPERIIEQIESKVRVAIGIVNHEYQVMRYEPQIWMEGVKCASLGPVYLEHEEEWEEEIGFVPAGGVCATTVLAEPYAALSGTVTAIHREIKVRSIEGFEPGDEVIIDNNARNRSRIESIGPNNTFVLAEPLEADFPAGTLITETRQIQFRLNRIHKIGDQEQGETSLTLWRDNRELTATVENRGMTEADYSIVLKWKPEEGKKITVKEIGPIRLAPVERWDNQIVLSTDEPVAEALQLSLYKDDELIFEGKPSPDDYLSLHIQITVVQGK